MFKNSPRVPFYIFRHYATYRRPKKIGTMRLTGEFFPHAGTVEENTWNFVFVSLNCIPLTSNVFSIFWTWKAPYKYVKNSLPAKINDFRSLSLSLSVWLKLSVTFKSTRHTWPSTEKFPQFSGGSQKETDVDFLPRRRRLGDSRRRWAIFSRWVTHCGSRRTDHASVFLREEGVRFCVPNREKHFCSHRQKTRRGDQEVHYGGRHHFFSFYFVKTTCAK